MRQKKKEKKNKQSFMCSHSVSWEESYRIVLAAHLYLLSEIWMSGQGLKLTACLLLGYYSLLPWQPCGGVGDPIRRDHSIWGSSSLGCGTQSHVYVCMFLFLFVDFVWTSSPCSIEAQSWWDTSFPEVKIMVGAIVRSSTCLMLVRCTE